jgi:hypothetical protein
MAQEDIDAIDAAIQRMVEGRRGLVARVGTPQGGDAASENFVKLQAAIEALHRAREDEGKRLPSIYETQGIREV